MTIDEGAREAADWLLDAIATATQNRMFLRGDEECDAVACEAILLNAQKAIKRFLLSHPTGGGREDLGAWPQVPAPLTPSAETILREALETIRDTPDEQVCCGNYQPGNHPEDEPQCCGSPNSFHADIIATALAQPQERSDGARTPPNTRLRNVVEQMLAAIERGAIDSEENAGEPEVGIPPHRWHEEWSFYARAALDASPPLSPWRAGELP